MNISKNISLLLSSKGIIRREEIDVCQYGLDTFIATFIEILSILIISAIMGNFIETFLLFATFVPLRVYAGGYHAETRIRCFLVSLVVYAIFYLTTNMFPKNIYLIITCVYSVFSLMVVILFAPVVHKNKKVNQIERIYYRKFSLIITLIEIFIILLFATIFKNKVWALSLASGQFAVATSSIMAIVKDKIKIRKGGACVEKV